MKKILELGYHRDPNAFRVGELPAHAYFIPFDSPSCASLPREESPFLHLLSGEWKFLWKPSVYDMDDFYINGFDLSEFETVTVPENWQLHGSDYTQYQASAYPFLIDPPYVPEKNPAAAYVKDFDVTLTEGKRYELHFEGKDSCVYVFMNGEFVGYGEVPHCDSAFDVTPYLRNGSNRLAVLVLKWCSGSYFDDQDKIRLSGLFRDVYLLERSAHGITDFSILADTAGNVSLAVESGSPVTAEIYDGDRLLASAIISEKAHLKVDAPRLWSAETPNLYELRLSSDGEFISRRFGFRETAVKDGVFTVNGKAIKLYGVNRHDSNENGYVTPYEFMRRELCLMKRHNVNAIRTSHYTNDPRFYELCDELGFYVMAEADLECHGFTYLEEWNRLVDDPAYSDVIHDRIVRMYEAFKNAPSIVTWSLGNESSFGSCLRAECDYIRAVDPSRTLHYEGAQHSLLKMTEEEQIDADTVTDFLSFMYPTFETLAEVKAIPHLTKPLVLCEYSHAMGNSCGDLRFYDDFFEADDRHTGGFIWEWCDHGLPLTDKDGKRFFGYGGDFGEKHHLRNICMDGLTTPDRRIHSSLLEAKAVFAPVRVAREADGSLTVLNRSFFRDLSEYVLRYTVTVDGSVTERGTLDANPAPRSSVTLPPMTKAVYSGAHAVLTVTVELKAATAYAEEGYTVTAFSFALPTEETQKKSVAATAPTLTETRAAFVVSGKTPSGKAFAYTLRKDSGAFTSITVAGEELLASPVERSCFRAPTDNDNSLSKTNNLKNHWATHRNFGNLEYTEAVTRNLTVEVTDTAVVFRGDFLFGVQGRMAVTRGTFTYAVDGNGALTLGENATVNDRLPYFLPRYGYLFHLKSPAEKVSYFGYGPSETYEDKCSHALLGHYEYTVDDPDEMYEHPQECGSHAKTETLTLSSGGATLTVDGCFSFAVSRHSVHAVAEAKHKKDLEKDSGAYLSIDFRMSGVGSASCGGQHPLPACRINAGDVFSQNVTISLT